MNDFRFSIVLELDYTIFHNRKLWTHQKFYPPRITTGPWPRIFSFTHLIDSQIPQSSWEMGNSKMFLFIIHVAFSFVNFFLHSF